MWEASLTVGELYIFAVIGNARRTLVLNMLSELSKWQLGVVSGGVLASDAHCWCSLLVQDDVQGGKVRCLSTAILAVGFPHRWHRARDSCNLSRLASAATVYYSSLFCADEHSPRSARCADSCPERMRLLLQLQRRLVAGVISALRTVAKQKGTRVRRRFFFIPGMSNSVTQRHSWPCPLCAHADKDVVTGELQTITTVRCA
jgi:hypothetical protein